MLQKQALRKAVTATLAALSPSHIAAQSERATARIVASEWWTNARVVCLYLAMSKELQLDRLFEAAFADGKRVLVPRVTGRGSGDMVMLEAASLQDISAFPRNKWGIPEPPATYLAGPRIGSPRLSWDDGEIGAVEVVVVPGVAFDARCNRLGHGRGYYDCWIAKAKARSEERGAKDKPLLVGVCLDEQLLPSANASASAVASAAAPVPSAAAADAALSEGTQSIFEGGIPMSEHDIPMDMVITPSAVYTREKKAL
jgi:5-formyltetrahydrofolate cyclo-ligase